MIHHLLTMTPYTIYGIFAQVDQREGCRFRYKEFFIEVLKLLFVPFHLRLPFLLIPVESRRFISVYRAGEELTDTAKMTLEKEKVQSGTAVKKPKHVVG